MDVWNGNIDAFAELGPRALQHLKHMIGCVNGFLDLLADPETDFRAKLMNYAKVKEDGFEFCRFYTRWLDNPSMERPNAEIYELLEGTIDWWGGQDILSIIDG